MKVMNEPSINLLANSKVDFARKASMPWLFEGLLPAGVVTGVVGKPLSGKSSLAFHMAKAVGTGTDFAGYRLNGGARKVVWVSAEDGWAEEMQQRGERGWDWLDVVPEEAVDLLMPNDMDRFEFIQWWGRLAEDMNAAGHYGLVVVDHLLGFLTSRSSEGIDRPQSMGPFLAALGQLARDTGCAIILIHHENKSGGAMGSVNFGVRTRETIAVRRNSKSGAAVARVEGNRISPFEVRFKVLKPHVCELESGPVVEPVVDVAPSGGTDEKVPTVGSAGRASAGSKADRVAEQLARIRADLADAPEGLSVNGKVQWLREERGYADSASTLTRRVRSL